MADPTEDQLQGEALEENLPPLIRKKAIRVTAEGLEEYLSGKPSQHFPGPDSYLPAPHSTHSHLSDEEISFGTTHVVGRDLRGKTPPVRPLDKHGPDPYSKRHFLGDEFPGMLTFDAKGNPTYWSRFPRTLNVQDIRVLNVSIATTIPKLATGRTSQAKDIEAMEDEAFNGKPVEEVFARIDDKTLAMIKKYAAEFEMAYGIKMNVQFDHPNPHLTVMGYTEGDPDLLGFAAFPPSINEWPSMEGLGHHPAYMMLNNQYTRTASDYEVYNLFTHEFGHTLGFAHPHDLAILNMNREETLTATKMAYTDLKLEAFRHIVTDAEGIPISTSSGEPQYFSAGPDEGVLDFGFRKWTPTAPTFGAVTNANHDDPANDLYKGVFDLDAHFAYATIRNFSSLVFWRLRKLPMVPMINDGQHTVMKGSKAGDDFLDTNVGYASIIKNPRTGITQKFVLVEGFMQKVMGRGGNNTIIPAQHGDQEILPGKGDNHIQLLYPDTTGTKTITSEGNDTLVITETVLNRRKFAAAQNGNTIELSARNAKLILGGTGISRIRIISGRGGHTLCDIDVHGLSAEALNSTVFKNNAWKALVKTEATKQEELPKAKPQPLSTPSTEKEEGETPERSWTEIVAAEDKKQSNVTPRGR